MVEKIELPSYLQDISDDTAKDMVSVGGSVPRISIRGRQFRFVVDGEETVHGTNPIEIIIVGVVPSNLMAKTFYIHGYQPGSTEPPDCSSFFGEVPDTWVESPQAMRCSDCEQNKWGSATSMSGKKAKACKDSKRLMVIKASDAKEDNPTIYILNVTIASLKALTEYGKFLLSNKLPMAAAITQVAFVDSEFPQVEFNFVAVLNEKMGMKMLEIAERKEWMDTAPQLEAPTPQRQISAPTNNVSNPPTHTNNEEPPSDNELLENW